MSIEKRIAAALRRLDKALLKKAHVVGYGVGHKRSGSRLYSGPAPIFFVDKKVPSNRLKPKDRLPRSIMVGRRRLRTDVVQISALKPLGDPTANENQGRADPILMGFGIGICEKMVDNELFEGTLGALTIDSAGSKMLLSAAHVMMDQGLDVITPPARFTGHNHDPKKFPPTVTGAPPPAKDNKSSVVRIAPPGIDGGYCEAPNSSSTIVGINAAPVAPVDPAAGLPVKKSGLSTGVTKGKIVGSDTKLCKAAADIWRLEPIGQLWATGLFTKHGVSMWLRPQKPRQTPKHWHPDEGLKDLFFVEAASGDFGTGGDSGSLIVTGLPADDPEKRNIVENSAVGLLIGQLTSTREFGGATINVTYVVGQKITTILKALGLTLAP
jgi:hypothetical protein